MKLNTEYKKRMGIIMKYELLVNAIRHDPAPVSSSLYTARQYHTVQENVGHDK